LNEGVINKTSSSHSPTAAMSDHSSGI